jgi:hypothetical protein
VFDDSLIVYMIYEYCMQLGGVALAGLEYGELIFSFLNLNISADF